MIDDDSPLKSFRDELERYIISLERIGVNLLGGRFQGSIEDLLESAYHLGYLHAVQDRKKNELQLRKTGVSDL